MPASVALVKCSSYDRSEVEDALGRAMDLLGGAPSLLGPGGRFLVKPNFLFAAPRARLVNTDPEVVRAVVRLAEPLAREIVVGDSPGLGTAVKAARRCGLSEALEGTPAKIVEFTEGVEVDGRRVKRLRLAREALECDALLNVAKLKSHGQMFLTMAVKNLFGCVPGLGKVGWHMRAGEDRSAFARILVEIARALPARLHVLDAVVAMEGNGPSSGTARAVGALLVSADPVALDRVAVELLELPPDQTRLFEAAREIEFGEPEIGRIEIVGDDVNALKVKGFRTATPKEILRFIPLPHAAQRLLRRVLAPAPSFSFSRCTGCGLCVKTCPAKALTKDEKGRPVLTRSRCVRCMCCQEICPEGAISVTRRLL